MSPVQTIGAWGGAKPYLEGLQNSMLDDVRPLLDLPGGAPFAVCREVFSYLDHLGHLYTGLGKGHVADRFKSYLKEIMGQIDSGYTRRAVEIYEIFRNGTVHQFEPKHLDNSSGQRLGWLCYQGKRVGETIDLNGSKTRVTHLQVAASAEWSSQFWLPVATNWLVNDVVKSTDIFGRSPAEEDRVKKWNKAADQLRAVKPAEMGDFEWTL